MALATGHHRAVVTFFTNGDLPAVASAPPADSPVFIDPTLTLPCPIAPKLAIRLTDPYRSTWDIEFDALGERGSSKCGGEEGGRSNEQSTHMKTPLHPTFING
jgi:hypothetical protein